jgi:hypothetical protein
MGGALESVVGAGGAASPGEGDEGKKQGPRE